MKFRDCQSSVVSSFSTLPSRIRHNAILQLAIPSVVTNITVPLLGLVDMTVVGHMGHHEYIGAIAIGTTIFNMIYWLFAFLRMGTTGIASQAYGAGDAAALRRTLFKGVRMALGFSTVMLLLQTPLLRFSLWLMQPDDTMATWTSEYFRVCIWGAPAMLLSFVLTGWFIGRQDTRTPMWTAILQNILNILCTLIFVFVFGMNVRGVALGTVTGLYGGCLFAAFRALRATGVKSQAKGNLSEDGGSKVSVYTDIFLRTLCLVAVTVSFTSMGSRMGGIYLDANALLMQFFIVFSYFTDGLANAAEALSGKYYGAHDAIRLRSTVRQLFLMGSVLAIVFTTFYAIGGEWVLSLLTNQQAVVEVARSYLPWVCAIPIVSLAAFVWDGIFIGLTRTREMFLAMLSAAAIFFILWFLLGGNNHALWLCFLAYLGVRSLMQTGMFFFHS